MNLTYKKASINDIDILTETRIKVLRAANNLSDDIDMSEVEKQSYEYYKKLFAMVHTSRIWYWMKIILWVRVGLVFFR